MNLASTEFLRVGRIVATHGLRGEVRVLSDTDFPEERFASGSRLLLQHPSLAKPLSLTVKKARPHKNVWLVSFEEWSDINQIEPYKGGTLVVPVTEMLPANEEGEFYLHQIIGCQVVTTEGRAIGRVQDIYQLPANDVWVVRSSESGKNLYLPYIEQVVKQVDIEKKQITIEWMEGLG
jgi:16S rRNA processing protein RimM